MLCNAQGVSSRITWRRTCTSRIKSNRMLIRVLNIALQRLSNRTTYLYHHMAHCNKRVSKIFHHLLTSNNIASYAWGFCVSLILRLHHFEIYSLHNSSFKTLANVKVLLHSRRKKVFCFLSLIFLETRLKDVRMKGHKMLCTTTTKWKWYCI